MCENPPQCSRFHEYKLETRVSSTTMSCIVTRFYMLHMLRGCWSSRASWNGAENIIDRKGVNSEFRVGLHIFFISFGFVCTWKWYWQLDCYRSHFGTKKYSKTFVILLEFDTIPIRCHIVHIMNRQKGTHIMLTYSIVVA